MTTLSFWLPCSVRRVVRKLIGRLAHRQVPLLDLTADENGLRIRAIGQTFSLEYCQAGTFPAFVTPLPLALLDLLKVRDQPVDLFQPRPGLLRVHWHDRGVPRSHEYELPDPYEPAAIPALPETWSENQPDFLTAFRNACATTDSTSSRYAFHCIQLRGKSGAIGATDGRQGLLQSGFSFPFSDDLLIGSTDAFECQAVHSAAPVQVGATDSKFVIRSGGWTFWLPIEVEARFPRLDDCIPALSGARTSVEFAAADLRFLRDNLNRLPATADDRAVTLDLTGTIAVRAAPHGSSVPTELVLTKSSKSGEDLRLCFGRQYLARVAEMNLPRLHLYGPDGALRASDDRRSFVWMPYAPSGVILPHESSMRVESSSTGSSRSISRFRRQPFVNSNPTTSSPAVTTATPTVTKDRRRKERKPSTATAIEAAIALQEQFRGVLRSVKDLIRQMRAERKQQRLLKSTLASLKQLQQVA